MKRASDYEKHLGEGRLLMYRGNPRVCPEEIPHEPHMFRYSYLDNKDEPVTGMYLCDGDSNSFAERDDVKGANDAPTP